MPTENRDLLDDAQKVVRAWLREKGLSLLADGASEEPAPASDDVVACFLKAVGRAGFALELSQVRAAEPPAWVGYWTFRGSSFEGFRQPADSPEPEGARWLACAALLRNDWCRARLA